MAGETSRKRSPRNPGEESVNKRQRVLRNSSADDDVNEVAVNELETQDVVPESESNSDDDFEEEEDTGSEDEITNKKNGKRSKSSKTSLVKSLKANEKSTLKRLNKSQPKEKRRPAGQELLSQPCLWKNGEEFEESGSTSGVIKSIGLYNFMCHGTFYKEWHPNLNFVTGENGSGKSAILSGLLIGLGAKALSTSRTSSIKSLIKIGQTYAKTSITLLNNGSLSEEEYGDELTIERILDVKGTSSYKIKTLGTTRPLRKAELEKILLVLNIELDNPITILNQEAARNFLKTQNPNDKYKLFYQGTLLDKCERILAESISDHKISEKNFEVQRNAIQVSKKHLKELEKKAQIVRDMDSYRDQIKGLEAEYHWSVVLVMENKLAKLEESFEAHDAELNKIIQNFEKCTKELEDMKTNIPSEEQKKKTYVKLQERKKAFDSFMHQYTKVKGSAREINTQCQHKHRKIETNKKQIEKLEKKLEELKLKKANNNDDDEENKRALELELVELKKQFSKLKKEVDNYSQAADNAHKEVEKYVETRTMFQSMIRSKQGNIRMMNSSQADRFSYLGREMVTLIGLIETNKSKFSKTPKGPIAAYVKINEPKWAVLVEFILNHQLLNFVVDNSKDGKVLNDLISRVYDNPRNKRPNVNINPFLSKAYEISNGNASLENHPTVFDIITIEDDDIIIKNAIIDYTAAERILLFETNNDAIEIMGDHRRVPRSCKVAYTLEFYRVTPAPRLQFIVCNKPFDLKRAKYLKTSVQEDTGVLEREIEDIELQMSENNKLMEDKRKQETILRRDGENRQKEVRETHRKIRQIENEVETITKRGTAYDGTDDFMEEINDLKVECRKLQEEKERLEESIEGINNQITTYENEKQESEVAIDNLTSNYNEIEERLENVNQHIETLNAKIAKLKRKRSDQEEEKKSVMVKIEATKVEVNRKIAEAEENKARVRTKKSPENIKKELQTIQLKLESAVQLIGNAQAILNELDDTKRKFMAAINHVGFIEQILHIIKRTLKMQKDYFKMAKTNLGISIATCFAALISSRGYKGRLDINHEEKEIFYYVCPDNESSTTTLRKLDTKNEKSVKKYMTEYGLQLSGGERSYSTICFILALWQVLRSPFFMLDEFDVFMDPLNRKASQMALISHAQRFENRQFFLFTPLELSMMPAAGKASVLKMFPPKRNNMISDTTAERETNSEERENHHPDENGPNIVSSPEKMPSRARKVMAENISVRSRT